MNILLFSIFTITSIIVAYFVHLNFVKQDLTTSLLKVAKRFDLRIEQKEKLKEIKEDHYNSLPIKAHNAFQTLESSLSRVEKELDYANTALESQSLFLAKRAKKRVKRLEKKITKEKKYVSPSRIKATWEFEAEELVTLVAGMIKKSSKRNKIFNCKISSKYSRKMPTNLALREITKITA